MKRRCRECGLPLLPDGRCEFADDHREDRANAADLDRETRQLWEER